MAVLTAPRHPCVNSPSLQSHAWCLGQVIDDQPAIHYNRRNAHLRGHVADCPPELISAAPLHDGPDLQAAGLNFD